MHMNVLRPPLQGEEKACRLLLRLVKLRCIDEPFPHLIHCIEAAHLHLTAEHLHDLPPRNAEALSRALCEHPLWNAAMTARGNLCEFIGETCGDACRGVLLPSCSNGNRIRRNEADAVDLLCETVGRFLHHLYRKRAISLEDTCSIRSRDSMLLKPEHDVPQLGLTHIGGSDLLHRLWSDARDLSETAWRAFDDEERLRAEFLHDAPCHRGANAVDRTGGEKAFDAARARGRTDVHPQDLELPSKARMCDPAARQAHLLPDERRSALRRRRTLALLLQSQAKDRKRAVRGGKYDVIHNAREFFLLGVKAEILLQLHVTPPSTVPTSHNAA